jgi:hypothetical protein
MKGRAKVLDPFKDNLYRREQDPETGEKFLEKSCPKCSKKAGTLVFYRETAFGEQTAANGSVKPQRDCQLHRKATK